MYSTLPQLQSLRDLEKQIGEGEGSFKVIIWG